jgi:site-specific DNA recombinase
MVTALGNVLDVLRDIEPADKATIYRDVGLRLTYQPAENTVIAEAKPSAIMYEGLCPRGDLNPHAL